MDARARYEATMEAGPPEAAPEPCPVCGEPLTELMDGGVECEASGCTPCPVCWEDEATDGGRPCEGCLCE
jgi:hypothetical protein